MEDHGLSTHDVIISVDDSIVYENYWAPFGYDKPHRMYSVTKNFVAIAIGFKGDDVGVYMFAAAENFLRDYNRYAGGHLIKN